MPGLRLGRELEARAVGQGHRRGEHDLGDRRSGLGGLRLRADAQPAPRRRSTPSTAAPRRRRPRTSSPTRCRRHVDIQGVRPPRDVSVVVGAPGPDTDAVSGQGAGVHRPVQLDDRLHHAKLNEKMVVNPTTDDDRAKGVLQNDSGASGLLASCARRSATRSAAGRTDLSSLPRRSACRPARPRRRHAQPGRDRGKLTLDSAKLSDVLTDRFSEIKELLHNITGDYATRASSQRLDAIVNAWADGRRASSAAASLASSRRSTT